MNVVGKLSATIRGRRVVAGAIGSGLLVLGSLGGTWGIAYGQTAPGTSTTGTTTTTSVSSSTPSTQVSTPLGPATVTLSQSLISDLQSVLGTSGITVNAGSSSTVTTAGGTTVGAGTQLSGGVTALGGALTFSVTGTTSGGPSTPGGTGGGVSGTAGFTLPPPGQPGGTFGGTPIPQGGTVGYLQGVWTKTGLRIFEQSTSVAGQSPAAASQPAPGQLIGFVRPPSTTNPDGSINVSVPASALLGPGVVFVPAAFVPSWVQNFDGSVHIFSGYDSAAVDFGLAGPAYTTFAVTGPQVLSRLPVFDAATGNYGWIDASGVGPSGPPSS